MVSLLQHRHHCCRCAGCASGCAPGCTCGCAPGASGRAPGASGCAPGASGCAPGASGCSPGASGRAPCCAPALQPLTQPMLTSVPRRSLDTGLTWFARLTAQKLVDLQSSECQCEEICVLLCWTAQPWAPLRTSRKRVKPWSCAVIAIDVVMLRVLLMFVAMRFLLL